MSTAGHYVYTEASNHPGGTARFLTKEFDASHTDVCLQFYYSMYGASMGTLNVKVPHDNVMRVSRIRPHSTSDSVVIMIFLMITLVVIVASHRTRSSCST